MISHPIPPFLISFPSTAAYLIVQYVNTPRHAPAPASAPRGPAAAEQDHWHSQISRHVLRSPNGSVRLSAVSAPPTDNALTSRLFSYEVWHVLCMFISLLGYVPWARMRSGLRRMTAWHRSTKRSCETTDN